MSLTLALLREDLRLHLGMDSSDLDDTDADRLLNRSWWPIAAQVGFHEKDAETSFTTTAGTREYALPTDSDAIQRVVIQGPNDDGYTALTKIDDWNIFEKRDDEDQAAPTHYSRRGSNFILWPNPDDTYTVRVKYQQTLADIDASGPGVPQEWHEVILWGAVSRGFLLRGDWNRSSLAQNQQALYLSSLTTQKDREHEDRHLSGVRVLKRRYP
jgi:hypothetical protein